MKKKFLSLLLALAMFLSLNVPALAVERSASSIGDDFLEFYANAAIDSLISESDWAAIKKDYSIELNYVSSTQGLRTNTSNISEEIMTAINKTFLGTADNPNYNFSALTETIADTAFENALEQFNESCTRAHPGQTEMRNVVRTTLVSYDALKGKYIDSIPCGATQPCVGQISFGISSGSILRGFSIDIGCSFNIGHSITAHPLGTLVGNSNYKATHTAIFTIIHGKVENCSYDLYDSYTGEFIAHYSNNIIQDSNAGDYFFAVTEGAPSYLEHRVHNTFFTFPTINAYRNAVEANPHLYV